MSTVSSEELRLRAQAGDKSALGRLMERHRKSLLRWAHRKLPNWVRSVADTADLVQDALLRTLTRANHIDVSAHGALQAYLRQCVVNRVRDEFRTLARRGQSEPLDDQAPTSLPSPYAEAAAGELEARYKRALGGLRERDRLLIIGHVELEYSLEQLACMDGRTVNATRVALRRALVRLAQIMDGYTRPEHDATT